MKRALLIWLVFVPALALAGSRRRHKLNFESVDQNMKPKAKDARTGSMKITPYYAIEVVALIVPF